MNNPAERELLHKYSITITVKGRRATVWDFANWRDAQDWAASLPENVIVNEFTAYEEWSY